MFRTVLSAGSHLKLSNICINFKVNNLEECLAHSSSNSPESDIASICLKILVGPGREPKKLIQNHQEHFNIFYFDISIHGEKFWTRMRSKCTDLGEFEAIWLYKTIIL